jgi:phosphoribosylaminoimidazole-succinocarboxamide synthase
MVYALVKEGKVRNVYDRGDGTLDIEATNRMSAFDIVLADRIPEKGFVLNELSAHHLLAAQRGGVATHYIEKSGKDRMHVYKLDMMPVEVIVRQYLYGSAWDRCREGAFTLPKGTEPRKGARLTCPVVEFTTKLEAKDRPVTYDETIRNGWMTRDKVAYVMRGGVLVADQKLEFGRNPTASTAPILGDEVCTPDSSRFWDAELWETNYAAGRDQPSFDKQPVRDFLLRERGWDKKRPAEGARLTETILTPEVVEATAQRYMDARKRIMAIGS